MISIHPPRSLFICAWAVVLALAGCSEKTGTPPVMGPNGKPLTKIRFQTDYYPQAEHGGFYQALAKGYYREEGLDVDVVSGGLGSATGPKLLSSQMEFAMSTSDSVILNAHQGVPFVIVGAFMQHDPMAVLLHEDDPVKTFADLKGRPVMTTPGSIWVAKVKARYGVEFPIIPMNYGITQFMADPRFIQQCFVTNEPYFLAQNGVKSRTLLLADSGYDPYRVIFGTRRFIRDNPEVTRAFVAASLRGWDDFMNGDPSPAKALILERNTKMTAEIVDFGIRSMREYKLVAGDPAKGERLGRLDPQRLREQADLLLELKVIGAPVPLEKFVDFQFLPPDLKPAVTAP